MLERQLTSAKTGAAPALMEQLGKSVKADGAKMASKVKGMILFKIDDSDWTLDLREGTEGELYQGAPKGDEKPDLTLTLSDANFAQLVMGKLNPQTAFLMRKLKIGGAMAMAMKLQPILDAAAPKAKM